jgi:hypothetical protein
VRKAAEVLTSTIPGAVYAKSSFVALTADLAIAARLAETRSPALNAPITPVLANPFRRSM